MFIGELNGVGGWSADSGYSRAGLDADVQVLRVQYPAARKQLPTQVASMANMRSVGSGLRRAGSPQPS